MVSFVGKWNESHSKKNSEIVGRCVYKGLLRGSLIDSKGCLASKYFMIRNFLILRFVRGSWKYRLLF